MRALLSILLVASLSGCLSSDEGGSDDPPGDTDTGDPGGSGSDDLDPQTVAENALRALDEAGALDDLKGFTAHATTPDSIVDLDAEFGSNDISRFGFTATSDGETTEGAVWCSEESIVIESDGQAYALPNQGSGCDAAQYTSFVAPEAEYDPECDYDVTGTQITVHCDAKEVDGQQYPEVDATVLLDASGKLQSMTFESGDGSRIDATFEYGERQELTMPEAQSFPGWP